MKAIGQFTIYVIFAFYAYILNGWALAKLWAWFIAPLFYLPLLTIPQSIGLAFVVNYLTEKVSEKKSSEWTTEFWIKAWVLATLKPLMAIVFGLIIKSFL